MELSFPIEDVILQFAVVVVAALVVQLLFELTRVPGLIGLIVLGMAVGPGGIGLLPQEPVVELFGSIGLLYIMFIAGAEIDLDLVRDRKREAASFGAMAFALSFAPVFGIGLLFGLEAWGALLLAPPCPRTRSSPIRSSIGSASPGGGRSSRRLAARC